MTTPLVEGSKTAEIQERIQLRRKQIKENIEQSEKIIYGEVSSLLRELLGEKEYADGEVPGIFGTFGIMYGGKTNLVGNIVNRLRNEYGNGDPKSEEAKSVIGFYKFGPDTRYGTGPTQIGTNHQKDGKKKLFDVDGAFTNFEQIMELKENAPKVLAISEAPFWQGDFEKFTNWIKETNRILVYEGLGWYFNGEPVDRTKEIVEHSRLAIPLFGFDDKNGEWAVGTMRYATWTKKNRGWNLELTQFDEIGNPVAYEPGFDATDLLESRNEEFLRIVLQNGWLLDRDGNALNGDTNIDNLQIVEGMQCMVPCHGGDEKVVIGAMQAYRPRSLEQMTREYRDLEQFGMKIPEWVNTPIDHYMGDELGDNIFFLPPFNEFKTLVA